MNTALNANLPQIIGSVSLIPYKGGDNGNAQFKQYLNEVRKHPLLSAEDELLLLNKVIKNNDRIAAEKLVLSNLRFVIHIAKKYQGYGLSLQDLIQEGNIGLIKAIKRFNPKHKVRLITFAIHWIRAEIHEFIIKNWKIVKIATTKAQRKLFYRLRAMKKEKQWFSNGEINLISKELKVGTKEVRMMEQRLCQSDSSIDIAIENKSDGNESGSNKPQSIYLSAPKHLQPTELASEQDEDATKHELLSVALMGLDKRSRKLIQLRYLSDKKSTLDEIAKEFKISIERVRQLESRALSTMRERVSLPLVS
ncbi:MAG: RNA polymerase sigma factor RpoH [Methylacidiphilales bacterium]|nr:RNA polymerase sigma factor RpoH [Candidatus Methylacidiphilales bacterium]